MIDTSGSYWIGETADDIHEYLVAYSGEHGIDTRQVKCSSCGCDALYGRFDPYEGVIQVICPECRHRKILLDGEDVWDSAKPMPCHCPVCKKRTAFHLKVGFLHRDDGNVKHVFIGALYTECHTLGSMMDYRVTYGPTDRMESNI